MMKSGSKRWWMSAALAGSLSVGLVAGWGTNARADDDDEAPDTKFFRNVLRSIGLRDGSENQIEYRERSPLVVPPSLGLVPPETAGVAAKTPAWPADPDVKRARDAKAERRKPRKSVEEDEAVLLPSELNKGTVAARPGHRARGGAVTDPADPSSVKELGAKSIFSWGGLWGQGTEEYRTFTNEPPRYTLTQPPVGYRTPSPSQPYGVGKSKGDSAATNPMDTPAMRGE